MIAGIGGSPTPSPGGSISVSGVTPAQFSDTDSASNNIMAQINAYLVDISEDCTAAEDQEMVSAMDDFKTCTGGLDMMTFIQTLPSALFGGAMECALTIAQSGNLLDPEALLAGLPDKCAEVFLGSNPMGDVVRTSYLKPDVVLPCFTQLSDAVPDCKHYTWPMPIVGKWLKSATCIAGKLETILDQVCEAELSGLDTCLSGQESDLCSAQDACRQVSFNMNMMPPFLGIPMPDACLRVAKANGMETAVDLYNEFRTQCTEVWSGWEAAVGNGDASSSAFSSGGGDGGSSGSGAAPTGAVGVGIGSLGALALIVASLAF